MEGFWKLKLNFQDTYSCEVRLSAYFRLINAIQCFCNSILLFCSLSEFLCKECPRVHIFIDRIELKDIPEEQMYMRRWLHERFEIKDKWVAMCRTFCFKKFAFSFSINGYAYDFCVTSSASYRALGRQVVLVLLCIFCVMPLWLKLLLRRLGFWGFRPSLDWIAAKPRSRPDSSE